MNDPAPVPAACDPMGTSHRADLDAAAREIDALIAAGDVTKMGEWVALNAKRGIRERDAHRLAVAMRAVEKGAPT